MQRPPVQGQRGNVLSACVLTVHLCEDGSGDQYVQVKDIRGTQPLGSLRWQGRLLGALAPFRASGPFVDLVGGGSQVHWHHILIRASGGDVGGYGHHVWTQG